MPNGAASLNSAIVKQLSLVKSDSGYQLATKPYYSPINYENPTKITATG